MGVAEANFPNKGNSRVLESDSRLWDIVFMKNKNCIAKSCIIREPIAVFKTALNNPMKSFSKALIIKR